MEMPAFRDNFSNKGRKIQVVKDLELSLPGTLVEALLGVLAWYLEVDRALTLVEDLAVVLPGLSTVVYSVAFLEAFPGALVEAEDLVQG